jgi:site-specific DNA recombinase
LSNPVYIGKIAHKGLMHDGLYEPLIEQSLWDRVQAQLKDNACGIKSKHRVTDASPLAGKLFDLSGERLVPVHSCKRGRRYRYYVSSSLISKSNVSASSITLHLSLKALLPDGMYTAEQLNLIRSKPLTIKRRGIEMRLVIPGRDHKAAQVDLSLIRTIAKGHNWYQDWHTAEVSSIRSIATREGLSTSYVGDVIKLAFLSPKIVEAIVSGRQPAELVSNYMLVADLPLSWAEQEHLLNC